MPPKEFKYYLNENVFISVFLYTVRGKVNDFVVKLNCITNNTVAEIIPFDTAHGCIHKDVLRPDGTKEYVKKYHSIDLNAGVDFATADIEEHWEFYIERYNKWQSERKG